MKLNNILKEVKTLVIILSIIAQFSSLSLERRSHTETKDPDIGNIDYLKSIALSGYDIFKSPVFTLETEYIDFLSTKPIFIDLSKSKDRIDNFKFINMPSSKFEMSAETYKDETKVLIKGNEDFRYILKSFDNNTNKYTLKQIQDEIKIIFPPENKEINVYKDQTIKNVKVYKSDKQFNLKNNGIVLTTEFKQALEKIVLLIKDNEKNESKK